MRVEDFTFEHRPLSDLPTQGDPTSWLADFGGDDQWVQGGGGHVERAVVVSGDHIIIWQDEPLTEQDKRDAVAEYEETAAREDDYDDEDAAEKK